MAANSCSTHVIYAALVGNLLVAFTKAGAAAWTGSSAMLSEAVHSCVDIGNQIPLLYGMRRAKLQADADHPIGYRRELYFWSFIVALLVFALGAVVSIHHGILHVSAPEPIHDAFVNYVVLALAFVFEGASWWWPTTATPTPTPCCARRVSRSSRSRAASSAGAAVAATA